MHPRNHLLAACALPVFFLAACESFPEPENQSHRSAGGTHTAVADLISDYGFLADARDTAAVASLFTDDAALEVPVAGISVRGQAAIEAVYAQIWTGLAGTGVQRRHIISGLRLTEVTPQSADFRAIMNVTERSSEPRPQLHMTGYYTGKAVQTAAGWKFEQFVINADQYDNQ